MTIDQRLLRARMPRTTLLIILIVAWAMLGSVSLVGAASVAPSTEPHGTVCADVGLGEAEVFAESTGDLDSGDYSDGTATVTVTVYGAGSKQLDFSVGGGFIVNAAIIDAPGQGSGAQVYDYGAGVTSDTDLRAEDNPIKTASFCYSALPATPSPTPSTTPSQPTPTPTAPTGGGTGATEAPVRDAPTGTPTLALALLAIAAAGYVVTRRGRPRRAA